MSTIHRLARRGDAEGLRTALGESADPRALANEVDDAGWTPLYYAATAVPPSVEAVRALLETGADPGYVRVETFEDVPDALFGDDFEAYLNDGLDDEFDDDSEPDPEAEAEDDTAESGGEDGAAEDDEAEDDGADPSSTRTIVIRRTLLGDVMKAGDLDVIRLLRASGADLTYRDESGYTALLHAVYGVRERLPLIRELLALGIDPSLASTYGESPLGTAYGFGQWAVVAELLAAGADPAPLGWTPLHRAIAIGTREEVLAALDSPADPPTDLNASDEHGRPPLDLALFRGDAELARLLAARGASPSLDPETDPTGLVAAAAGGHPEAVALALEWGAPPEAITAALHVAVDANHHAAAGLLLRAGADPDHIGESVDSSLQSARDPEMTRLLLDHGADLAGLDTEGRRRLLGLPEPDADLLEGATREEYLASRHPREGTANPEDLTDPFRIAMIRSGARAYRARDAFDDEATYSCAIDDESDSDDGNAPSNENDLGDENDLGEEGERPSPVWCFDRFGQSTTILPDGRIVLVAGEHEDSYDSDFCIYNDVAMFSPDGGIALYGYPYAVFPPTDFHSATLVGEWIYLVGSLGYVGTREGPIPVARLSVLDFAIEPLATGGAGNDSDRPGRIFEHRARLVGESTLRISGGQAITFADGEESHDPNPHAYDLDLRTLAWTRVGPDAPEG